MIGRYSERQNYTPAQATDHLRAALAIVDELDVPDDLRVAAFTKAADLLSAKQVLLEQAIPGAPALL